MFTIDFFAKVGAAPVASRTVDAQLVDDAVRQAEALLADPAAGLGQDGTIIGYAITDSLNAIVYDTFENPGRSAAS